MTDPNRITPPEPGGDIDAAEAKLEAREEKYDVKYHEWKERRV